MPKRRVDKTTTIAIGLPEALEQAKVQLAQVTGLRPVTITRAFRDEEGWHVGLEMLEMSRIPSSTDVLGKYEVLMDAHARLVRFTRKGTRLRGQPLAGEEEVGADVAR